MGIRVEIPSDGLPATKREALAVGSRFFMPKAPCSNGHLSVRVALPNRSRCIECKRAASRRAKAKAYRANPERHRAEARVAQAAKRAAGTDWASLNKGAHTEMKRAWKSLNMDRLRADAMRRKAAKLSAIPAWLSPSEKAWTIALYRLAAAMSAKEPHEVDHIIPLQGRTVCGLHVPWNLRVITATENNRRPRIWDPQREAA